MEPTQNPSGGLTEERLTEERASDQVVETDTLVEEVSIDGMCGVY